jgi:uncharacterized protein YggT (Ycf19 family)
MSHITDTGRVRSITGRPRDLEAPHLDQEIMQRVTGLITLGVSLLNALICTRFLLKLMDANPANPFAQFVYSTTAPLLTLFRGLIQTVTMNGNTFEFSDLVAIAVYAMLGWSVVRLLRILFTRVR